MPKPKGTLVHRCRDYLALPLPPTRHRSVRVRTGRHGVVTNGGRTVRKTSQNGWNCAAVGVEGWSTGVHEWDVELVRRAKGISVGVAVGDSRLDCDNAAKNAPFRYDLFCGNGTVTGGDDAERSYYEFYSFNDGDVVRVRLDADARTLTFGCQTREMPLLVMRTVPAFTDLPPSATYYPYVAMWDHRAEATFQ
jgi:hypothetical protein